MGSRAEADFRRLARLLESKLTFWPSSTRINSRKAAC